MDKQSAGQDAARRSKIKRKPKELYEWIIIIIRYICIIYVSLSMIIACCFSECYQFPSEIQDQYFDTLITTCGVFVANVLILTLLDFIFNKGQSYKNLQTHLAYGDGFFFAALILTFALMPVILIFYGLGKTAICVALSHSQIVSAVYVISVLVVLMDENNPAKKAKKNSLNEKKNGATIYHSRYNQNLVNAFVEMDNGRYVCPIACKMIEEGFFKCIGPSDFFELGLRVGTNLKYAGCLKLTECSPLTEFVIKLLNTELGKPTINHALFFGGLLQEIQFSCDKREEYVKWIIDLYKPKELQKEPIWANAIWALLASLRVSNRKSAALIFQGTFDALYGTNNTDLGLMRGELHKLLNDNRLSNLPAKERLYLDTWIRKMNLQEYKDLNAVLCSIETYIKGDRNSAREKPLETSDSPVNHRQEKNKTVKMPPQTGDSPDFPC